MKPVCLEQVNFIAYKLRLNEVIFKIQLGLKWFKTQLYNQI